MARLFARYRAQRAAREQRTHELESLSEREYCRGAQYGRRDERDRLTKLVGLDPDEIPVMGATPEFPRYKIPIFQTELPDLFGVRYHEPRMVRVAEFQAEKQRCNLENGRAAVWWTWRRVA